MYCSIAEGPGNRGIGAATGGREAVIGEKTLSPDIVLLDIKTPDMNGVEAAKVIRSHRPDVKIIMLTTFNDKELISEAIAAGAKGYILKDTPVNELIAAIKSIHNGNIQMSEEAAKRLTSVESIEEITEDQKKLDRLSNREKEILQLIAAGENNGQIANKLFLSEKTVRNYVSSIYDTLDIHSRAQVVVWALQRKLNVRYR